VRARFQIPVLGAAVLLALLLLRVWDPAVLQVARHRVFDIYQHAAPRVALDAPVVIVAIDEPSLAAHDQWPWPRTVFADLVEAMARAGAAAIASEVVWTEPDRTSPENIVHALRDLDPVVADGLRAMRSNDAVLAKAFQSARVVLGQSPASGPGTAAAAGPRGALSFKGSDPTSLLPRVTGWATNLGILEQAAAGIGALTLQVDPDGVLPRPALLVGSEAGIYPVLALEALRVAVGHLPRFTQDANRQARPPHVQAVRRDVAEHQRALARVPHRTLGEDVAMADDLGLDGRADDVGEAPVAAPHWYVHHDPSNRPRSFPFMTLPLVVAGKGSMTTMRPGRL